MGRGQQGVGSGVQNRSMVGGGGNGALVGRRLRLDPPHIWTFGQSLVLLFVGQYPSKSVKTKPISCRHKMQSHNSLDAVSGSAGPRKRSRCSRFLHNPVDRLGPMVSGGAKALWWVAPFGLPPLHLDARTVVGRPLCGAVPIEKRQNEANFVST